MPRRIEAPESQPEVDAETDARRFRQLARRLRLSVPLESEQYNQVKRSIETAEAIDGPAARLEALLDLADEIRPALSAAVRKHTLPESLNGWRGSR
jgi:hypothetical protein